MYDVEQNVILCIYIYIYIYIYDVEQNVILCVYIYGVEQNVIFKKKDKSFPQEQQKQNNFRPTSWPRYSETASWVVCTVPFLPSKLCNLHTWPNAKLTLHRSGTDGLLWRAGRMKRRDR